jgi:hypothetical protein
MADVHQIEAAVGEDDFFPPLLENRKNRSEFLPRLQLVGYVMRMIHSILSIILGTVVLNQ